MCRSSCRWWPSRWCGATCICPGNQGLLNTLLGYLDIGPIRWLNSSDWALPSLAILRIWKISGYAMVLFLAGLQSIPAVYYEAAAIDGANAWHRFWRITLPLLMPTMAFVVVITTIGAMLEFTTVYVMTIAGGHHRLDRGGPNFATYVMSYHIFKTAITNQYEGLGQRQRGDLLRHHGRDRLLPVPLPEGQARVLMAHATPVGRWSSQRRCRSRGCSAGPVDWSCMRCCSCSGSSSPSRSTG